MILVGSVVLWLVLLLHSGYPMFTRTTITAGATVLLAASALAVAEEPDSADRDPVRRGKYLVHGVAMCVECHSPRGQNGDLIEAKLLQGGRIPVGRPYKSISWAATAPQLAGLPGLSGDEAVELLVTGKRSGALPPRPPMPPFRLERSDAEAIVAYLKSLDP